MDLTLARHNISLDVGVLIDISAPGLMIPVNTHNA